MTNDELRRRLHMDEPSSVELFHWLALRDAYQHSSHEPIMLNMGNHRYEAFGPTHALAWAERLAAREL